MAVDLEKLFLDVLGYVDLVEVKKVNKYLRDYHGDYSEAVAKKYLKKKARKIANYARAAQRDVDEISGEVEQRLKVYLEAYTNLTPNDELSLRRMAVFEVQMKHIEDELLSPDLSPEARASLLNSLKTLSAEHRQVEHLLGIDKRTRDEDQGGSDMVDRIGDIMDEAADYYKRKIVEVIHCGIKAGHILMHFEDWEFTYTCPRCKKRVILTHEDMKEKPHVG